MDRLLEEEQLKTSELEREINLGAIMGKRNVEAVGYTETVRVLE